jgi:predicted aspartyl protease
MLSRLLVSAALLAGSSTASAQAQVASPPAAAVDNTTQTEDVRFKNDSAERMTVPVLLSGKGPYRFLVDTGANRTAVSRQVASALRLTAGEGASLHDAAGVSTIATATVPTLQLTRKEIRNVDAALLESVNMGADGILGTDSLRSQRVLFDFEAQTLSIVPSAMPDFRAEPGTIVVQGSRRNGRLVVTEATANSRPMTVIVDTGAQYSIGNAALRKALLGTKVLGPSQQVELQTVSGDKLAGEFMFVREIEIGGVTLRDLLIVFADAHTFKLLGYDKKPAMLLGMNAMRAFKKVSIDFANRRLRVVIPEHSALDLRVAAARLR